jgi:hypothetical protein
MLVHDLDYAYGNEHLNVPRVEIVYRIPGIHKRMDAIEQNNCIYQYNSGAFIIDG